MSKLLNVEGYPVVCTDPATRAVTLDASHVVLAEALQVTLLIGDPRHARSTGPQCAIEVLKTNRHVPCSTEPSNLQI